MVGLVRHQAACCTKNLFFESGRELLFVWVRSPRRPARRCARRTKDPKAFGNLETVANDFIEWWKGRAPRKRTRGFVERISAVHQIECFPRVSRLNPRQFVSLERGVNLDTCSTPAGIPDPWLKAACRTPARPRGRALLTPALSLLRVTAFRHRQPGGCPGVALVRRRSGRRSATPPSTRSARGNVKPP